MKGFFKERIHGVPVLIPVGIVSLILIGLIVADLMSTLSPLGSVSDETPSPSPTPAAENSAVANTATAASAFSRVLFGRARLAAASRNDFSDPALGQVLVTLTNSGSAAADRIDLKVEFLNVNQNIIATQELAPSQNTGIIIPPGGFHTFVFLVSEELLKQLNNYHLDFTWHSRR